MPHDNVSKEFADSSVCCPKSCNTFCNDCLTDDPNVPYTCKAGKMCDRGTGGADKR